MKTIVSFLAVAGLASVALATNGGASTVSPYQNTVQGTRGGANVLFYVDFELAPANSVYRNALTTLGWTFTEVNTSAAFSAELTGTTDYTHVISAQQNFGGTQGFEVDLANYIAANPGDGILVSDWRVTGGEPSYLAASGLGWGGNLNPAGHAPVGGGLFDGLSGVTYNNPGWGIFAYDTAGGVTEAVNGFGPAISRSGNVFFNGFLSDVFGDNTGKATEYVIRELGVPAPGAAGLLAFAGIAAARRRRA